MGICVFVCVHHAGKLNVKDEELDEMLNEGKGPINFTVFLTLFGEKLNGTIKRIFELSSVKRAGVGELGFIPVSLRY